MNAITTQAIFPPEILPRSRGAVCRHVSTEVATELICNSHGQVFRRAVPSLDGGRKGWIAIKGVVKS